MTGVPVATERSTDKRLLWNSGPGKDKAVTGIVTYSLRPNSAEHTDAKIAKQPNCANWEDGSDEARQFRV